MKLTTLMGVYEQRAVQCGITDDHFDSNLIMLDAVIVLQFTILTCVHMRVAGGSYHGDKVGGTNY